MRLIDADALYETLCNVWYRSDSKDFENAVFEIIQKAPDAQPERKKGKWIVCDGNAYRCSCCGKQIITNPDYIKEHKFCFGCGADMRGEQE